MVTEAWQRGFLRLMDGDGFCEAGPSAPGFLCHDGRRVDGLAVRPTASEVRGLGVGYACAVLSNRWDNAVFDEI